MYIFQNKIQSWVERLHFMTKPMSIKITSNQALVFVSNLKRQLVSGSSEAWLLPRRRALRRSCPQRHGTIPRGLSMAGRARCLSQGPSTAPGTASPEPGPGNPVRSSRVRAGDKAPAYTRGVHPGAGERAGGWHPYGVAQRGTEGPS